MAPTNYVPDTEKDVPLYIDDVAASDKDLAAKATPAGADYTGAVAKTDPAEIALVRKLDMRVMPALFAMYFLYADQHYFWPCVSTNNRQLTNTKK